MTGSTAPQPDISDPDTDPEDRVHHHARLDEGRRPDVGGPVRTLCGLLLDGPRPGAEKLPCCPMCGDRMAELGMPCRGGPR